MTSNAKVLTIFGTRPEAIKFFPVVQALAEVPGLTVRTCVTAQHRGLLDQVLAIAGLIPDIDLDLMEPGQSLDRLTARLLTGLGDVMDAERPDRVLVQGDTATAMVGALAAYYRKVPVGHVEAGLRSGDIWQPWPEEVNRRRGAAAREYRSGKDPCDRQHGDRRTARHARSDRHRAGIGGRAGSDRGALCRQAAE